MAGREVIILEREDTYGVHTSSRNSGCIHAGINYPPGSLKARLNMRGKELLKRLVYGRMAPVPRELTDGVAPLEPLCDPPPRDQPIRNFEVIYAVVTLGNAEALKEENG